MTFGQVVLPTLFSIHECESDLHSNEHKVTIRENKDQYQYLGSCPPTPPLTQQQSIDNKLLG